MLFWIEVRYVGGSSDDMVKVCYGRAVKDVVVSGWEVLEVRCCAWCYHGPPSCNTLVIARAAANGKRKGEFDVLASTCTFSNKLPSSNSNTACWQLCENQKMEYFSLKRSTLADRGQANLSSKVYVRSTKSGKVQKIVRELYLRQDIPCSSNLCRECLEIAPTDYSKKGSLR